MATWTFQLLGPITIFRDGEPVHPGGPLAQTALAVLLLNPAGIDTEHLTNAVWGSNGATRDTVYHCLTAVRRSLGTDGPRLQAMRPGYRLQVADAAVDWRRFGQLLLDARQARRDGAVGPAVALLESALACHIGPPLGGIGDRLRADRQLMTERGHAAKEELADLEITRGSYERVVDLLSELSLREPGRTRSATLLLQALSALGRADEADAIYRRACEASNLRAGADSVDEISRAYQKSRRPERPRPANPTIAAYPPSPPDAGPNGWQPDVAGLPRRDPHFTGRATEVAWLTSALQATTAPICVVVGMAGVGKTALAARVAQAAADHYPDGRYLIDLHAHTAGRSPLSAAEGLDWLLRRLGVPASAIPVSLDERVAVYHSVLARRRVLVIIDNAHDVGQVRPLVPVSAGCGALITSRQRLPALDDAAILTLTGLPEPDAIDLFRSVVGPHPMLAAEPDAEYHLARIAASCRRLPLAIRIAAAIYRIRDGHTLAAFGDRLIDADKLMIELDDGERGVATSFALSVADLSNDARTTLGQLAIHPGPDLDLVTAAALFGQPLALAQRRLESLVDRHLLMEARTGRYEFHDLIRAFVRGRVTVTLTDNERGLAWRRLVDYYQVAAERADRAITPHRYRPPLDLSYPPTVAGAFDDDYDAALAWLTQERANIRDVCLAADTIGPATACWQLAYSMRGYYFITKEWADWITTHEAGLHSARAGEDRRAEGFMLNNLGLAHLERGRHDLGEEYYLLAFEVFTAVGDEHGAATARANRAWIPFYQGKFQQFIDESHESYRFYREHGAPRNAAIILRCIGLAETELGRYDDAVTHLREAVQACHQLDLRLDLTMAYNGLGEAYLQLGDRGRAAEAHHLALAASDRAGSIFERARARHRLGQIAAADGDHDVAGRQWTLALADYTSLGAAQRAGVARLLERLGH